MDGVEPEAKALPLGEEADGLHVASVLVAGVGGAEPAGRCVGVAALGPGVCQTAVGDGETGDETLD